MGNQVAVEYPKAAEVERKIAENRAERQQLTGELEEVEQRAILTGDSDPAVLDEIARLQTRLRLATGHGGVLQREFQRARAGEALERYGVATGRLRTTVDELKALENSDDWKALEERYKATMQQRARLRRQIVQQVATMGPVQLQIKQGLPEDASVRAEMLQAIDGIDASIQDITDTTWRQLESW